MPVRGNRRVIALLLTGLLVAGSWSASAGAQTAPALTVTTSATYRVVPDEGRVEVEFGYSFENRTTSTAFPAFFESLPTDARDVVVTEGSTELLAGPTGEVDGFQTWLVAFSSALDPGDSTEVVVSWVIDGGSALPGPIVEAGAAAFDVYVPAPEGATWTTPEIEVPDGYVAVDDDAPSTPYELVRVRYLNPEAFSAVTVALPPEMTVSDWSTSDSWTGAVVGRSTAVVTSLENWFGLRDLAFELRRTLPSEDHPAVDEALLELVGADAESVDHQLAHAWLVNVPVDEAWFIEGLAAAFAGDDPVPGGAAEIVPLIVNEIGAAGVRAIVDALRAEAITYPGPVLEQQPLPADWRTVLDHVEGVGGADDVTALFRAAVIDSADGALLDRRAAARLDYEALVFRAGGWALPPYLRRAMASWDFDAFSAEQAAVSDVIQRRDSLLAWAESLELAPRDDGKEIFEMAETDMVEVQHLLDEQEKALVAFDEAERLVNGDRGLLAGVGLMGHDPDGDLQKLRDAWADGHYAQVEHDGDDLAALVEGAVGDGTIRLLVPGLGLIALWQLIRWLRNRRRVEDTKNAAEVANE